MRLVTKGLNRNERLIIILYYYEELTMKEIGATLDLSESRVSQMHSCDRAAAAGPARQAAAGVWADGVTIRFSRRLTGFRSLRIELVIRCSMNGNEIKLADVGDEESLRVRLRRLKRHPAFRAGRCRLIW